MATVLDLLRRKDSVLHVLGPEASVLSAVRYMNAHRIGALLVTEGTRLVGIFTERDVLTRVAAEEKDLHATLVGDVMTREVLCCSLETDLEEVSQIMKQRRIRHLPIRGDDGKLQGVISIGDVNAFNVEIQQATIDGLSGYICGRS